MTENLSEKSQPTKTRTYKYIANNTRTTLVTFTFSLFVLMSALIPIIGAYFIFIANKANELQIEKASEITVVLGNLYDKLSLCTGLTFIFCAFIFSFWIYRANNNTHSLHAQKEFEFTPAWCIGSYFMPIKNLIWPYNAMMEIWQNDTLNNSDKDSDIIAVWWISFLLMNFLAVISSKFSVNTIADMQTSVMTSSASSVCGIVSAVAAIKIIRKINKSQIGAFKCNVNETRKIE